MAQWRSCTAPVSGWLHYADHGVAPMCRSRAGALHPSGARRFIPAGVGNTCPSLFIPPSRSDLSTGANGWPAVWPGCDAVEKRAAEKAAVQAALISTCFFEFYLFRRFSSTIARTRAIFQPTRAILHPPGAGPWMGSANLGRHALKFEGFHLSPASGLPSIWTAPPMIASRSPGFVRGDGKVARVGWKIARVSSAISPHASAITPRSATFARHASATAPASAIIERLGK